MTVRSIALIRIAPSGLFRAMARETWTRLRLMVRARHTRLMLGDMDDRMLADIGIGRGDASMEAARPMWELEPKRRR